MKESKQPGENNFNTFLQTKTRNKLCSRISQLELKQCIESLSEELKKISDSQKTTVDLDAYVKKLMKAKQRVTVVSNVLQDAQERLNKVHLSIEKETIKRRVVLESTVAEQSTSSINIGKL